MLNFLDGLFQYPRPGFNQLEREWYWDHVISNEGLLVGYQELAEKVAKDKEVSTAEALEIFLNAAKEPQKALAFLGGYFVELQKLELKQQSRARNADGLLSEMFLRSRLTPQWLVANSAAIDQEYGVKIDAEYHKNLRRSEWLNDAERRKLIQEFCSLMPVYQIREIAKVATLEMNEGHEITLAKDAPLGKPESGSPQQKEPQKPNEKIVKMPTSESQNTA